MLIGKEPIHFNRIKSETHKIFEVTSQRCKHVHLKMLKLYQYLVKLPLLSLDYSHPFTLFSSAESTHYLVRGKLHLGFYK